MQKYKRFLNSTIIIVIILYRPRFSDTLIDDHQIKCCQFTFIIDFTFPVHKCILTGSCSTLFRNLCVGHPKIALLPVGAVRSEKSQHSVVVLHLPFHRSSDLYLPCPAWEIMSIEEFRLNCWPRTRQQRWRIKINFEFRFERWPDFANHCYESARYPSTLWNLLRPKT